MAKSGKQSPEPGETRRSRADPRVRAALALEQNGALLEAAEVYQAAGEAGRAGDLRLEHAQTVDDADARLRLLRRALASVGNDDTPTRRRLAAELGRALLTRSSAPSATDLREAAEALTAAGEHAAAGTLFERLDQLEQAAAAYERAGAVSQLEAVHAVLEHRRHRRESDRRRLSDVDGLIATGRIRAALAQIREVAALDEDLRRAVGGPLAQRLEGIRSRLPGGRSFALRFANGTGLRVFVGRSVTLGRAPDCDIVVPEPRLSRQHCRIEWEDDQLVVRDLGSRGGTFVEGDAATPGAPEPLQGATRLELGTSASFELKHGPGGLLVTHPQTAPTLLTRSGCQAFDAEGTLGCTVEWDDPVYSLRPEPAYRLRLGDLDLERAACDLLHGFKIRCEGERSWHAEVVP